MSTNFMPEVKQNWSYNLSTDLVGMVCPECGITYAIPLRLRDRAWELGHGKIRWYCPRGDLLGFHGKSEAEREREARERAEHRAQAERDLRVDTEHRLRAQKGATTKARKRHAAGVCPCCNRTFQQLQRHMATKHPNYDPARS